MEPGFWLSDPCMSLPTRDIIWLKNLHSVTAEKLTANSSVWLPSLLKRKKKEKNQLFIPFFIFCYCLRWNFLYFRIYPSPLVLSLWSTNLHSILHFFPLCIYTPWCGPSGVFCFLDWTVPALSSQVRCTISLTISVAIHWTCSAIFMSLLYCRAQNQTLHSKRASSG